MTLRIRLFLCAAMFLLTVSMAAQITKIMLVSPPEGPLEEQKSYDLTFVGKADNGSVVTSKVFTVAVRAGSDAQVKKKEDLDTALSSSVPVTTGPDGTAAVTLATKTNTAVVLDVSSADTTKVFVFAWPHIAKFSVDQNTGPLTKRTVYPDALVVTAKGGTEGDEAAAFQPMRLRVVGAKDARLFVGADGKRENKVDFVTDGSGKATLWLETGEDMDLEFLAIPLNAAGEEIQLGEQTVELSGLKTFDTFHSRRLFTEVFTGATFTNDYDENGEATGFNQTGPLVRVTFDTLWYNRKESKKNCRSKNVPPEPGLNCGSLIHTGVDMEVSSFPFGSAAKPEEENPTEPPPTEPENPAKGPKGLENAFSGAMFVVWQPDRWASYTSTSELTGYPTDALRLGIFAKVGVTTRATVKETNGDTSFGRAQIGLRFTHHQTKVATARSEQDNIVPIRFVEVSYGRFEEFAGETEANRFVLDAGFRLPGLGSNAIPFYAGIHLNAGRGPDDLRIFAGFLFKINELATMFQQATQ